MLTADTSAAFFLRTQQRPKGGADHEASCQAVSKTSWTMLGVLLTSAALLRVIAEARLAGNHNETLLSDSRAAE